MSSRVFSTKRTDRWWIEPSLTAFGFLVFVLYTTWRAFSGVDFVAENYLSPFYSPLLFSAFSDTATEVAQNQFHHSWFGIWPASIPPWIPTSPAIFILIFPLSFRMTCYYYRKFYYRSFFLSPPACAVQGMPRNNYKGETGLLVIQNIHRFTLYIAILYIGILYYDGFTALFHKGEFGIGVGTIILLLNPTLMAFYVFGCHAFRHLIGGSEDCFTCPAGNEKIKYKVWKKVSILNSKHMLWAWVSMIWVALTDLYIMLVANGTITDFNTWSNWGSHLIK